MLEITYKFKLDFAHRIWNQKLPDGMSCKCVQLHGHTVFVEVSLTKNDGKLKENEDMILDFNIVKVIANELVELFDHKTLVASNDPEFNKLISLPGVIVLDFVPTAERLAIYIANFFKEKLKEVDEDIYVTEVKVYESPKAWATYKCN